MVADYFFVHNHVFAVFFFEYGDKISEWIQKKMTYLELFM